VVRAHSEAPNACCQKKRAPGRDRNLITLVGRLFVPAPEKEKLDGEGHYLSGAFNALVLCNMTVSATI
jgi:hypothetical protein